MESVQEKKEKKEKKEELGKEWDGGKWEETQSKIEKSEKR